MKQRLEGRQERGGAHRQAKQGVEEQHRGEADRRGMAEKGDKKEIE